MDNAFLDASPPKRAGLPGKDLSLFHIAPLDPVLKDRVYGKHAGQNVYSRRSKMPLAVRRINPEADKTRG
jgi:hypothetical protein